MGLFSFLRKNKQDGARVDSGLYSSEQAMERARSKRASNANGDAADPVLPEKKRARRRLVGAIALALAVALGLPMILDTEPKPLPIDIAIQIPAKDKPVAAPPSAPAAVAASDALDPSEEIVSAPLKSAPAAARSAPVTAAPSEAAATVPAPVRPELPAKGPMPLVIEAPRAAPPEAPKVLAKIEPKPSLKVEPQHDAVKPEPAKVSEDAARAMAILEGKPSAKPAPEHSAKFALQIAALATQEKVDELQTRLKEAGIHSYTQKTSTAGGERIRVRLGPFASKEEAEKARSKLENIGLSGTLVPL